jgi:hypothetical protein
MTRIPSVSVRALFLAPALLAPLGALAAPRPEFPRVVALQAEKLYVPNGFDSNDNVEVVVHGHLPSTCYKVQDVSVERDDATGTITVQPLVFRYRGPCLQMLIPFTTPAKLGLLKPGKYTVKQKRSGGATDATLTVRAAVTESPDDFLYAPVDNVKLSALQEEAGAYKLTIEGNFPYMFVGCMRMQKVVTDVQGEILVVQPVAEIVDGPECSDRRPDNSYSYETVVRGALTDELLVHVRSLNGESFNRHFQSISAGE